MNEEDRNARIALGLLLQQSGEQGVDIIATASSSYFLAAAIEMHKTENQKYTLGKICDVCGKTVPDSQYDSAGQWCYRCKFAYQRPEET